MTHATFDEENDEKVDHISLARRRIGSLGEVLDPKDAEEPILARNVRAAIHGWLMELAAQDELKGAGLRPRSTALLSGPPGTGKTTLAHHLAARLGVPLVSVGAENILSPYLGESEKKMASLFDAIRGIRAIILIDEIDAIGRSRDMHGGSGAAQAMVSTLTVMLRRIESFQGILIAATNKPATIDSALWRRFALQITVDLPDEEERFAILARYGLPYQWDESALELLTELTAGASPALLRGLMEGYKRALIIGPRLRWPVHDVARITRRIIVALTPPPEMHQPPPLWADEATLHRLADMPWPPVRDAAE